MKSLKDFNKNKLDLKSSNFIFGGETISTEGGYTVGGNTCETDEHVDTNNNGKIDRGERIYYFDCE